MTLRTCTLASICSRLLRLTAMALIWASLTTPTPSAAGELLQGKRLFPDIVPRFDRYSSMRPTYEPAQARLFLGGYAGYPYGRGFRPLPTRRYRAYRPFWSSTPMSPKAVIVP
jgi:hypothetical protein